MNRPIHASDRIILAKLVLTVLKSSDGGVWPCHSNCDHEWQKMRSLCQWTNLSESCRIQTELVSFDIQGQKTHALRSLLCLSLPWLWHSKTWGILRLYREKKGETNQSVKPTLWSGPLTASHTVPSDLNTGAPHLYHRAQPTWVSGVTLEMVIGWVPISSLFHRGNLWSWEECPGNSAGEIAKSLK